MGKGRGRGWGRGWEREGGGEGKRRGGEGREEWDVNVAVKQEGWDMYNGRSFQIFFVAVVIFLLVGVPVIPLPVLRFILFVALVRRGGRKAQFFEA